MGRGWLRDLVVGADGSDSSALKREKGVEKGRKRGINAVDYAQSAVISVFF